MMTTVNRIGPQAGPQTEFLSTSADVAFFGGAAGVGKTFGLLLETCRHICSVPGFGAVIFRRVGTQIKNKGGLWDTSMEVYPHLKGRPREYFNEWTFPPYHNRVKFAHMQHAKNRLDWQGSQIALICFDELTHFTREQVFYMFSRNRSLCGVRPYMRGTYNPVPEDDPIGGWIHEFVGWYIGEDGYPVAERSGIVRWFVNINDELHWFMSRAEAAEAFPDVPPKSFTFIRSTIHHNPILLEKDPGYLANLMALPLVERERLLNANHKIKAAAGLVFNRAWFEIVPSVPKKGHVVFRIRYWDKAGTQDGGAFTAGLLLAYVDGTFYIEDLVMGQWGAAERERVILQTAQADAVKYGRGGFYVGIEQEPGSGGKESAENTIRNLRGFVAYADRPVGDKVRRSEPVSAQAEQGNVKLVAAEWNGRLLNILHNFPDGIKDPVDALSGGFSGIIELLTTPQDGVVVDDTRVSISPY
jgi:predicted phage terminase large subunit-like protein